MSSPTKGSLHCCYSALHECNTCMRTHIAQGHPNHQQKKAARMKHIFVAVPVSNFHVEKIRILQTLPHQKPPLQTLSNVESQSSRSSQWRVLTEVSVNCHSNMCPRRHCVRNSLSFMLPSGYPPMKRNWFSFRPSSSLDLTNAANAGFLFSVNRLFPK